MANLLSTLSTNKYLYVLKLGSEFLFFPLLFGSEIGFECTNGMHFSDRTFALPTHLNNIERKSKQKRLAGRRQYKFKGALFIFKRLDLFLITNLGGC